jgi:hypothetical protein
VSVAVEIAVNGIDPVKLRARHFERRDFARLEACCERGEFEIVQGVGHGSVLHSIVAEALDPEGSFDTGIARIQVLVAVNQ